ncbi:MAG: hypothetical protein AAFQ89_23820 [Cyanobacteria bacterium J06626_18]
MDDWLAITARIGLIQFTDAPTLASLIPHVVVHPQLLYLLSLIPTIPTHRAIAPTPTPQLRGNLMAKPWRKSREDQLGTIDTSIDQLLEAKQQRIELVLKGKRKTLRGLGSIKDLAVL